jgi:hypothetical protein
MSEQSYQQLSRPNSTVSVAAVRLARAAVRVPPLAPRGPTYRVPDRKKPGLEPTCLVHPTQEVPGPLVLGVAQQ